MKPVFFGYRGAAALTAAFLWGAGVCFAGEYERLAGQLAKTAKAAGLSRLVISEFAPQGAAGPGEAAQAQQRLSKALFELQGVGVMDADVLETLKERGRRWGQVLVAGEIYRIETGTALVVKIKDLRYGRLLATMQITVPEEKQLAVPKDLRDAPGDTKAAPCAGAREKLLAANQAGVELKARYWAALMRDPGFSYAALDSAPGSELRDYTALQKFYRLLNAYYEQAGPVILTETERSSLEALMAAEAKILSACARAI